MSLRETHLKITSFCLIQIAAFQACKCLYDLI